MAEVSSVSSTCLCEPAFSVRSELDDSFFVTVPEKAVRVAVERVSL